MTAYSNLYLSLVGRKPNTKEKENRLLIYLNIRVSGVGNTRMSTGISIPKSNFKNGGFTGRSAVVVAAEKRIASLIDKITNSYSTLICKGVTPMPNLILENIFKEETKQMSLMDIAQIMIEQKEAAVLNGQATSHLVEKFLVMKTQLAYFMNSQLDKKDIYLYEINLDFINKFVSFLKAELKNNNVTINKKIGNFGQYFKYAIRNDWTKKDPTLDWKLLPEPSTNEEFLTPDQFKALLKFELPNQSHEVLKDSFIFMCLTGLAFSDMKKFSFDQIKEVGKVKILEYTRTKLRNNKPVKVPLVDLAVEVATKHYNKKILVGRRDWVSKSSSDPVFSVPSMKIYNEKIKRFFSANDVELPFSISSHCGRKTFGNMINMKSGIGAASTLLGHSNLSTTQKSYVDNAADHLLADKLEAMNSIFDQYK